VIQVIIGTTASRRTINVPASMTIREILEQEDIQYQTKSITMDGVAIGISDFDRRLESLGVRDKTHLLAVEKQDNA
jgi:hypothetical protein